MRTEKKDGSLSSSGSDEGEEFSSVSIRGPSIIADKNEDGDEQYDNPHNQGDNQTAEYRSAKDEDDIYTVMHKITSCFFSLASDDDENNDSSNVNIMNLNEMNILNDEDDDWSYGHHAFIFDESHDNESKMSESYYSDLMTMPSKFEGMKIALEREQIRDHKLFPKELCVSAEDDAEACIPPNPESEVNSAAQSKLSDSCRKQKCVNLRRPKSYFNNEDNERKTATQPIRSWNAVDVLCHDIMMQILSFLPTSSIAAFSETARRPNFECFYFLQLQLERASLWNQIRLQLQDDICGSQDQDHYFASNHDGRFSDTKAYNLEVGKVSPLQLSSSIARLSILSPIAAQTLLEQYLQSNSSLRNKMSSSHRLVYLRHAFLEMQKKRKTLPSIPHLNLHQFLGMPSVMKSELPNTNVAAAAAVFMTAVLGGAYYANYVGLVDSDNNIAAGQALLSVGIGAIMNMKKKTFFISNKNNNENVNRERKGEIFGVKSRNEIEMEKKDDEYDKEIYAMEHPCNSNPYDHIPDIFETPIPKTEDYHSNKSDNNSNKNNSSTILTMKKKPSGCIGAYRHIINNATIQIKNIIKQSRAARYASLSDIEKESYGTNLIDLCGSDDNLVSIKNLVYDWGIPVDAFFHAGGNNNDAINEVMILTCALHVAAFHGACEVLDFLCRGIYPYPANDAERLDGGLADINVSDDNGWTALHFAAGANRVEAVYILAKYGAKLTIEATNGYTPYRWAERLSNKEVQEALASLGGDKSFGLDFYHIFGVDISGNGGNSTSNRSFEGLAESLAVRVFGQGQT